MQPDPITPFKITTCDPQFDPRQPVTVNGFLFIPAEHQTAGHWLAPKPRRNALTVYQPWASLIMAGAKPYEFRKWNPRERGGSYAALIGQRIVIHASQRPIDRREVLDLIDRLNGSAGDAASTALLRDKAMPILDRALDRDLILGNHGDLPWSCGLGTAVLGEPKTSYEIAGEALIMKMNDSDRYNHALFGWPMLDVEVWDQPIPMRGRQGFWTWPTPAEAGL